MTCFWKVKNGIQMEAYNRNSWKMPVFVQCHFGGEGGGDFFPDILFETMFPSTAFLHCLCAVFESCIGTAPLMSTQV